MNKMEDMFLLGQESSDDKKISPRIQNNGSGIERKGQPALLEFILVRDDISKLPFILDVKELNRSGRFNQIQKYCYCTNPLIFSKSFDFDSTSTITLPCVHSAPLSLDTLHIFCRKNSLSSIPPTLIPSSFKCKHSEQGRKLHAHDMTNVMVECSPVAHSGFIPSLSTRWVLDSIETTLKTRNLMKSSFIFQSVPEDVEANQTVRSISVSDEKLSELVSPFGNCSTVSGNPEAMNVPCRIPRSGLSRYQEMHCSCSSSSSSCQSDTSAVVNSAILRCVWDSGYPNFTFFIGTDHRNAYMTSPHKIKSSVNKALDFIYLFYAWNQRKESKNHVHNSSIFVGKMKVRGSLLLDSSRLSKCVETEFVLSAANESSSIEAQRITKSKGLSSKLSEIFRGSHHSKSNSSLNVGDSRSQFESLPKFQERELGMIKETGCQYISSDNFPPNLELAAIVIKDFALVRKQAPTCAGWGLKFLEKVEPLCSTTNCEENCMQRKDMYRNVNVLVPAGIHGGPIDGTCGPASLIGRWRSNGHCDCGGWDVGCPLTVLNNLQQDLGEDSKFLNLFVQGSRQHEPVFQMFSISKDTYTVNFQSSLSALQAFSVAVASIHSQNPDLCLKW